MKHLLLIATALFFTQIGAAKSLPEGSEDCSFACKSIPPLNQSQIRFGEPTEGTLNAEHFQILVWNLYKGRQDQYTSEFLKYARDSDILMLQEVLLNSTMSSSFSQRGEMNYAMAISFLMKNDEPTGVATGSTAAYLETIHQRTEDKEPFSKSPKTNMLAYHPLSDGQILLTINIHGMNRRSTEALARQVELAKPYILAHAGPVVFAGDFNTRSQERHDAVDKVMFSMGLKKMSFDRDPRSLKDQLDVVYYKDIKILRKRLIMDSQGSDHPAIIVEASTEEGL